MSFTLDTLRLHLRPIEQSDLSALVELDSDPLVMKYISGGKANSHEDYAKILPRILAYEDRPTGYFAACSMWERSCIR